MTTEFNRGAVKPVQCFKTGYALVQDQYWLFLGIILVGMLIGGALPFGILLGPMMCGIYLCFFAKMRGERVKFELLFKGFDYFGRSVLAGVVQTLPMMIMTFLAFLPAVALPLVLHQERSHQEGAVLVSVFAAVFVVSFLATMLGSLIAVLFFSSYPLIVERGMPVGDALKTSFRAVMGNAAGILGLFCLNVLIGIVLLPLCCVGVYLVLPISMASYVVAYRSMFPELQSPAPPLLASEPPRSM